MDERCIAIFDSGVGSLALIRELIGLDEDILYLADRKHHPYGLKDSITLERIISNTIDYLCSYDPKIIIVASITPTLTILDRIRIYYDIPIFGIYIPFQDAISIADEISIIGTRMLINNKVIESMIKQYVTRARFKMIDASSVIERIEKGDYEAIKSLKIDTPLAILASTHLSLVKDKLSSIYKDVRFIDGISDTAKQVTSYLKSHDMLASKRRIRVLVSKDLEGFKKIARDYLPSDATFEEVDLAF